MLRINVLGGLYVQDGGRPLSGAAAQPRRLALLALLASAAERGVTRDALLAFLWPDADEERGRKALAQALYALRRDLGSDDAVLGMKDLRLNPDVVVTDVGEFHDALATGNLERAAAVYQGQFLEGFHLPGAETFERWVEDERAALAHKYTDLLHLLAERAAGKGEHRAAVGWLRRLAAQDPLNARIACQLMENLAAQGDVAGALQHARVYETLLRQELDLPPDREVLILAERLRAGAATPPASSPVPAPEALSSPPAPLDAAHPPSVADSGVIPDDPLPESEQGHTSGWATLTVVPAGKPRFRPALPPGARRRWPLQLVSAALLLAVGWFLATRLRPAPPPPDPAAGRVVAIGRIAHYLTSGRGALGQPLADMLATNLARAAGVRVVSSARMIELLGQISTASDTTAGVVIAAARQAGATELVDGALFEVGPGRLRLDLRRVDLASGAVLRAYTMQGRDLFALADSGTARLVGDLGGEVPRGSLADVTTRSEAAYRFYEQGLRSYFRGDCTNAERLFERALQEDSTFAMAQFYYSRCAGMGGHIAVFTRLQRAVELAERASDRERLLIRATWAFANSSPATRAYAETLMVRYPAELEGYLMAGQGAILAGDYDAAHAPLLEVVARDSLGLAGQSVRCIACEALAALINSYLEEDSISAAVQTARRWTRLQPGSLDAWRELAMTLGYGGKLDSGRIVLRTADSLQPNDPGAWRYQFALLMWGNQFEDAAELARAVAQAGPQIERADGLWNLAVAWRHQGRLREALDPAHKFRLLTAEPAGKSAAPLSAFLEGQTLFEAGELRKSVALFDSISRALVPFQDSSAVARNRIWALTHMATALAALGDTAGLPALADTLQRLGRISGLARDRKLHNYVRGLVFEARHQDAQAVAAFRDAIQSHGLGYTRINYELAGALLRLNRPREAIPLLQSATRGGFEGANLYLTHTDVHERLAQAWEAAGQKDSAAAHYRIVAKAWERADPEFTPRRLDAAGRAFRLLDKQAGSGGS